jgi:hypothetical protein
MAKVSITSATDHTGVGVWGLAITAKQGEYGRRKETASWGAWRDDGGGGGGGGDCTAQKLTVVVVFSQFHSFSLGSSRTDISHSLGTPLLEPLLSSNSGKNPVRWRCWIFQKKAKNKKPAKSAANMTRKPKRSVAVGGAPPPAAPEEPEAVGVEVMESVVELGLGETDDDDIVDPRSKCHRWRNRPSDGTTVVVRTEYPQMNAPTFANQIVFLIEKGGTSNYGRIIT